MYKILTFRTLCVISVIICILMIFSSVANTFLPVLAVFKETQKEVLIIMYHQISENSSLWGDYVIPENLLVSDFEYLKNNGFTAVKIKDLIDFTNGKKDLPDKSVVITFDDGQRSFLTKVVPLLEKYNFPANVNIVGSLIDLYTENETSILVHYSCEELFHIRRSFARFLQEDFFFPESAQTFVLPDHKVFAVPLTGQEILLLPLQKLKFAKICLHFVLDQMPSS